MKRSGESVERDCPFLQPVVADWIWMYPTAAYCRPPAGRVRVPAPDSLARLCTSGHYDDCPGYHQALEQNGCPFIRVRRGGSPESCPPRLYCLLPSGRVRIPSHDELARFCAAGRYDDCAVFNRGRI
jgi:hypothetical protein